MQRRKRLISDDRSVIVSLDVESLRDCGKVAAAVAGVQGISGFKIGFEAGYAGLEKSVHATRVKFGASTTIIFDHQKGGNDIPDMGPKFASAIKKAGCDAAILFPFAGPKTQEVWTKSCQDAGLTVIVGGIMTHEKFLVSEGGYIANTAPEQIFFQACKDGVRDFVVPGTKVEWVKKLRQLLLRQLGERGFDLYAPGFIEQGGDISDCGKAAGPLFHAIVGRAIIKYLSSPQAMCDAAFLATSQIG